METIINENHIDELLDSLDDIHLYEPEIESLTDEEYQAISDAKYEAWLREEEMKNEVS